MTENQQENPKQDKIGRGQFEAKVVELLKSKAMTKKELAAACGLCESSAYKAIRNKIMPKFEMTVVKVGRDKTYQITGEKATS